MERLQFENIDIKTVTGIQAQDAGDIQFKNISIIPDKGPVLQLDECFTITIDSVKCPKEVDTFMQLIGKKTKGIKLRNVDMKAIANKIVYGKCVTKDVVTSQD